MSFTVTLTPTGGAIPSELVNVIKGDPGGGGGGAVTSVAGRTGAVTLAAADITDSTAIGRAVLQAASQAAARSAIDAAASGHTHTGTYQPLAAVLTATTASFTTAQETKLGHITVTQAVDLDAIETRVNDLDAAVVLKGTWDASGGAFPGAGAAQAGWSYIVSVGGTVDGVDWAVGDRAIAIADNASTSTYAAHWFKADYTDRVSSVNGRTGAVTTAAADITDSTAAGRAILTAADAAAQRAAMGAGTSSFSGAYADLTGKPTLGTAAALDHGTSAGNLVRLDATTGKLPPVDGSLLTNLPGAVDLASPGPIGGTTPNAVTATKLTATAGTHTTSSERVVSQTVTWNGSGQSMVARSIDVTNTASASTSVIDKVSVGGVQKFALMADGSMQMGPGTNATNVQAFFQFNSDDTSYVPKFGWMPSQSYGYGLRMTTGAGPSLELNHYQSWLIVGKAKLGFASGNNNAPDAFLARSSAGVVQSEDGSGNLRDHKLRNLIGTGNLAMGMAAKTADYTVTLNDGALSFDASGGARTATLPALSTCQAGQLHLIWKTDSSGNAVSADANASETINGSTSAFSTTTQWGLIVCQVNADKSGWLARAM